MAAMTMPFKIKDTTIFDRVAIGDSITATLAVSRVESWLENVTKTGTGDGSVLSPEDVMFRQLYPIGQPLPELTFVDHENREFSFGSLRGKAVAITFIYTRCPLPDFCILMSNHFSNVQKLMKQSDNVKGKWHLVTVSFDPKNDTPEVLSRYGKQYGADFNVWDFITAEKTTINAFATGFDLFVETGDGGLIDHTLRTVLLDKDGNLVMIVKGNSWTPEDLVDELKTLARAE
jgi:protein SCO1/2